MKFISHVRHNHTAYDLTVLVGPAVHIYDHQSIRPIPTVGIQSGHIGQLLRWRLHGQLRGWIERWISLPEHSISSSRQSIPIHVLDDYVKRPRASTVEPISGPNNIAAAGQFLQTLSACNDRRNFLPRVRKRGKPP